MTDGSTRFFGLDIHKEYFVAVAVNRERETVFGPQRVSNYQLDDWAGRVLTPQDAIVLEMTTNTYLFHDTLLPLVHFRCLFYFVVGGNGVHLKILLFFR